MLALKVSALASGAVLLDGKPIDLDGLERALREAKTKSGVVWYYGETSVAPGASGATPAMDLIIRYALPVRLVTTPDFADQPTTGTAQPVAGAGFPGDVASIFAKVRRTATGARGLPCLVIVRPDHQFLVLPRLQDTARLATHAGDLGRLIPPTSKRAIAVIADTRFAMGQTETKETIPSLKTAAQAIPFLGLLMALSYAGHAVWVYDGNASDLVAGCRDADVLIVDGNFLPQLRQNWQEEASSAMRNPNILLHDPRSYQLRIVRQAGGSLDHLEFPN